MAENNAINKQTEDLLVNKAAGDPFVNFQISSTDEFVIGVDDDDGDVLKINQGGASPSAGTTVWEMSVAGERSMVLQPAFLAYVPSDVNNQTGDGTVYTVAYSTEVFDIGGDYNNGTYTFTAPVTGMYTFANSVQAKGMLATHTQNYIYTNTSNRAFYFCVQNSVSIVTDRIGMSGSVIADMDSADTATVAIVASNGTKVVGVSGGATNPYCAFSGWLTV